MELLNKIYKLRQLYLAGELGGEVMPEDANPKLKKDSNENYLYFTLPMALNYQRNSYTLWQSALLTYNDIDCKDVFNPYKVIKMNTAELQQKLTKYKVALQPNKQPIIWQTLCKTLVENFNGSVINLFNFCNNDIVEIKNYILNHKKQFPYLSGEKILNYWLYVIENYTTINFKNLNHITIAPDTHVLQASVKLGIITQDDLVNPNIRTIVANKWEEILKNTTLTPIDMHTPLWLWSRNGFKVEV